MQQLDGFDVQELMSMGFVVGSVCAPALLDGPSNRVSPRSCIHCCCEKCSLLSRPFKPGSWMNSIEITQAEDFRCGETVKRVVSAINGPGDLSFYCSPCCGGSPWQRLNLHLAAKKGWQPTMIRLLGHWDLHWRLWSGFMVVAEHCRRVGAVAV